MTTVSMEVEIKVPYNHQKAEQILQQRGARFCRQEVLRDLYLVDDGREICKISSLNDEALFFVHLVGRNGVFFQEANIEIGRKGDPRADELLEFVRKSVYALSKKRRLYCWKSSLVALDAVEGVGDFLELYPADERERQELYTAFGVTEESILRESYYSLWKKQHIT